MDNNFTFPNFEPYDRIKVCGNIIGVRYLIDIRGFYPIIIGKADKPEIWLYTKINNVVVPVVEKNIAKTPQIKVYMDHVSINLKVFDIGNNKWIDIINLIYNGIDMPTINILDLRPLGFEIYGDDECLNLGKCKMKGNTVIDSFAFIGVG